MSSSNRPTHGLFSLQKSKRTLESQSAQPGGNNDAVLPRFLVRFLSSHESSQSSDVGAAHIGKNAGSSGSVSCHSHQPAAVDGTKPQSIATDWAINPGAFKIPRWKRILDITCILLTLPFWMPLMVLLTLFIKICSPGPVFFCQERVGYRGRRFKCCKFRSMQVNAETSSHVQHLERLMKDDVPMAKLDSAGDPRLIPFGRLIRASGLDELPQIFNVLRGEMSLVGPRPCMPYEFERHERQQRERFNAPPGLTGYWQVNGKNRTTFNEMIAMDIYYGEHMSVWLDLAIMLRTVPTLAVQLLESRVLNRAQGGECEPFLVGVARRQKSVKWRKI